MTSSADIIVMRCGNKLFNSQNRAVTLVQIEGWQGDRNVYDAYEFRQPTTPVTITANSFRLPIPGDEAAINPRFADEPVDYVFELIVLNF